MEPGRREQRATRVLKTTGFVFAGIGGALLALVGALAVLTAQPPPLSRGSVAGVILLVAGVVQLGRWQIARRAANGTDAQ